MVIVMDSVLSLFFDLIIVLLCMMIITKKIFWIRISSAMVIIAKVLGEGPTQELDDSTITAETNYPSSFTQ